MKVINTLKAMGYEILAENGGTKRGPDLSVRKDGRVLRVEIKKAVRAGKKFTSRAKKIEPNRTNDDLVAVEFASGYVLIEPMKQYIAASWKDGDRYFYGVF